MTSPESFRWKIERSSLGSPVVRRIRARTTRQVAERIVHEAATRTSSGESAGITAVCLYSSVTAIEDIGNAECDVRQRRKAMAHKRTTGSKAASNAGKVLSNPKSSKAAKSAAASALAQKHGKGKKR